MKKLRSLQGGYPRQQDYLLTLQDELISISDSLFASLGVDMVLRGCEITDNGNGTVNIAAGIVYVTGEVMRFDGANNVVSDGTKTFVLNAPATSGPKVFGDGVVKDVYSEVKAIVGIKTLITQVAIGATLYNLKAYINDVVAGYALPGEIKDIYDFSGTFLEHFDANGLGVTARYSGWHLMNGNGGAPDARGRVRLTAGQVLSDGVQYDFPHGAAGGEVKHRQTIAEMPAHNHPVSRFSPDAGANDRDRISGTRSASNVKTDNGPIGNAGGGQAFNIMQPYIPVYSIIKVA